VLITKTVVVKWNMSNRINLENNGYIYTKKGDEISIDVKDLTDQSHVKIVYKCDKCGKEIPIPFREYLQKHKKLYDNTDFCRKCDRENRFEIVKKGFKENNFILISDINEFKNFNTSLKYICLKHIEVGIQTTSYSAIKSNKNKYNKSGCRICASEIGADASRLSNDVIKKEFNRKNLILLSNIYKNGNQELLYICPKHPEKWVQKIKFTSLLSSVFGCYYCGLEKVSGKNNYNWKGGISPLAVHLRHLLYKWKQKSMQQSHYRCVLTNKDSDGTFEVHHLLSVNIILKETLKELDLPIYDEVNKYTLEELQNIETLFVNKNNNLLGVFVNSIDHKKFHSIYGYGDNTPEQWYEFVSNSLNKSEVNKHVNFRIPLFYI